MKKLLLILTALLISTTVSRSEINVLFLGNSFTAANQMTETLSSLASEYGDSIYSEHHWAGSQTLQQQSDNPDTETKINSRSWDYVVLQEQSQISGFMPGWDVGEFEYYSYNPAQSLTALIKTNSLCSEVCYFMTWGYNVGDTATYPDDTYPEQQSRIRRNYLLLANDLGGIVSPVGIAWKRVRDEKPWLNMYDADGYHPSSIGSYLAACVFFTTIFEESPLGLDYNAGVPDSTCEYLQGVAADVVLDSLVTWNIGEANPNAPPRQNQPGLWDLEYFQNVQFSWEPYDNADTYSLQVDDNDDFSSPVVNMNGLTSAQHTVAELPPASELYWRVRANYQIPPDGDCSTHWSLGRIFRTSSEGPQLLEPENEATCVPTSTRFQWNQSQGASAYRFQISTTMDFNEEDLIIYEIHEINTYYDAELPDEQTTYYWRVQPYETDETDNWSDVWEFATGVNPPEIVAPAQDAIKQAKDGLVCEWEETPGEDVSYKIQFSTYETFDVIDVEHENITTTTFSVDLPDFYTEYYMRIKVYSDGCESLYSDGTKFRTTIAPPALTSPADEAVDVPISNIFQWEASEAAQSYEIQIDTDMDFESPDFGKKNMQATQTLISGMDYGAKYYWRVRAETAEETSIWSEVFEFTTEYEGLEAPTLVSPENNSTMIPVNAALAWENVEEATLSDVQIALEDDFSAVVDEYFDLTETSAAFFALDNYTTYYWRVRNKNENSNGAWSAPWKFRTIAAALVMAPTQTAPENGATEVALDATFEWEALEGAETYDLQICTDDSFEQSAIVYESADMSGMSVQAQNLEYETEYFWRIRGVNEAGEGPWSDAFSFVTMTQGSVAPILNADIISVYPNPSSGEIAYEFNEFGLLKIEISDALGSTVYTATFGGFEGSITRKIDLSNLSSGVYILKSISRSGVYLNKIIIK